MHERHGKGQYDIDGKDQYDIDGKDEHNIINVKDGYYDFRNYPNVNHQLDKGECDRCRQHNHEEAKCHFSFSRYGHEKWCITKLRSETLDPVRARNACAHATFMILQSLDACSWFGRKAIRRWSFDSLRHCILYPVVAKC